MAFYYSRGDYEERIDECSQHTLLAATDAFRDRLSLALDEEQTVRTPHPESMTSMPRRREKYGEALRIAKQGLPRREKRLAKKLADPGADSGNRSRAGHGRSQPETQPILASGTNEVLINSEGRVSYGSWRGLVAYLTQICQPSDDYTKAFFLAFRSFATPSDLASALISRGAELLRARQASSDTKAPNTPTQTALAGVFCAIKHWYEVYWYSEADDPTLQTMCAFLIRDYLPSCQGAEEKECRNLLVAIAGSRDNIDISSMFAASEAKTTHAGLKHGAAGDDKRDGDSPAKAPQPRTKKGASQFGRRRLGPSALTRGGYSGRAPGRRSVTDPNISRDNQKNNAPASWADNNSDESPPPGRHSYSFRRRRRRRQQSEQQLSRQSSRAHSHPDQRTFWHRIFHRASNGLPGGTPPSPHETSRDEGIPQHLNVEVQHERSSPTMTPPWLSEVSRSNTGLGKHRASDPRRPKRNSISHNTQRSGSTASSSDNEPNISDLLMATVGVDLSLTAYRRISHIYQISPTDVACQLTIIESSCYCQIHPFELINKEFSRGDDSRAANVRQMTRWCTQITRWAAASILMEPTHVRRCRMLKYFIELGIQLLALKNYDAVMAIKAAIYSASVMRLKRMWSMLPDKHTLMCRRIHEAMDPDHNYANYRSLLRRSEPPFLPFLGLYLTDLTFIDDGNPTYRRFEVPAGVMPSRAGFQGDFHRLPPLSQTQPSSESTVRSPQPFDQAPSVQLTGQTCALFARRQDIDLGSRSILVNFEKSYRLAGVIQEVQKFQVEYSGNFTMAIPGLQQYLIEQWSMLEEEGYDDDKIYSLSLNWEPRAH